LDIVVDTREKSDLPSFLQKIGCETRKETLAVGDYIIGDVCVEHKSIADYANSLMSGHLHKQLYQMSYNFELSYLLVTGIYSPELYTRKIKTEVFLSSLVGSSYKRAIDGKRGQIVTIQTDNEWDSALVLKYLANKVEKNEPRLPVMERHKFSQSDWQLRMVSSLPKIGEVIGKALYNEFGSLQDIANANEKELMNVKGISYKKANLIYEIFHKNYRDTHLKDSVTQGV